MRRIGLFFALLPLLHLCYAAGENCNISGAVLLSPGPDSVVNDVSGEKHTFYFSLYPNFVRTDGCTISVNIEGLSAISVTQSQSSYTTRDVFSVESELPSDRNNFTWYISTSDGDLPESNFVCIAKPPSIDFSAANGLLNVGITSEGHCCQRDQQPCDTIIHFSMVEGDEAGTSSHFFETVTMTGSNISIPFPELPTTVGKIKFYAWACSGMLCGQGVESEIISLGPGNPHVPVNFTLDEDTIRWNFNSTPPSSLSVYFFISSEIEGPYELFPLDLSATNFTLQGDFLFGSFYFYVMTVLKEVKATSAVHGYTLHKDLQPEPVELVWPKNNSVIQNGTERVDIYFRSSSWGKRSSLTGFNDLKYFVNEQPVTKQMYSLDLSNVSDTVSFNLSADNGFDNSIWNVYSFTFCQPDTPSPPVVTVNEDGEEVEITLPSGVNFCDGLPGLRGYSVEVSSSTFSMLQWASSNSTVVKFPIIDENNYTITVKQFIGNEEPPGVFTENLTITTSKTSQCTDVFSLKDFEMERDMETVAYPHPIRLRWNMTFAQSCKWKGFNIFLDDLLVATVKESKGSENEKGYNYTIPSSLLPQQETKDVKVTIVAFTEAKKEQVTRTIKIGDNKPIPFPELTGPKHSSRETNEATLRWTPLAGGYQYEVYIGSSPSNMKLYATTSQTQYTFKGASGAYFWSVRACDASLGVCSGLSTPPIFYLCTEKTTAPANPQFEWTYPVTVSWTKSDFHRSCGDFNVGNEMGYYEIEYCNESNTVCTSRKIVPSESSIMLYDLESEKEYSLTFRKCDSTSNCEETTISGRVTNDNNAAVENFDVSGIATFNANSYVSNGTSVKWSVNWGRDCSVTRNCESMLYFHSYLIARIPSGDVTEGSYSFTMTDDTYLVNRTRGPLKVVAYNGNKILNTDRDDNYVMCRPNKPSTPGLMLPGNRAGANTRTWHFEVAPLAWWGDCYFGSNDTNSYTLTAGEWTNFSHPNEMEENNETGSVGMWLRVGNGNFNWNMVATNYFNMSSPSTISWSLTACEFEPPLRPNFTGIYENHTFEWDEYSSSSSQDDDILLVSPHQITLTWTAFDTPDFGVYCGDGGRFDEQAYVKSNWDDEWEDLANAKLEDTFQFKNYTGPRFDKGRVFYFYINASNGKMFSVSKILKVKTMDIACGEDIICVNDSGYCNRDTVKCVCYGGFAGEFCEQDLDREKMIKIIIGVCVGGFVLLAAIGIIVTIMVVKYYRKHKALMMKPPDFETLRVPPIKMPSSAPDVDLPSDLSILEAALLSPTGFQLIWDLLHHTSATEIDIMAKSLVYAYQKHGRGLELQMFLIMCEICESQTSTVLFRANSPATRAFKFFSKMYALPYLYRTFAILLQSIIRDVDDMEEDSGKKGGEVQMMSMGDGSDGENACSDENINALKLQLMCQKFFVQILRSDKACPGELKHICAFMNEQLSQRYPDFVFKGIGAFLFLRFYNTAITVPESYGLMPTSPRPSVRKQLLLVSKVLQNLANDVMFGEKEPNMARLNSFLTSQRPAYEQFIRRLCDNSAPLSEPVTIPADSYRAALAVIFSQFLLVVRNNPDYLKTLDCMPPDLAELIQNSFKKNRKKKEDPAEQTSLLDSNVVPAPAADQDVPPPAQPPAVDVDDDYYSAPAPPPVGAPADTTTTTSSAPPPSRSDDLDDYY